MILDEKRIRDLCHKGAVFKLKYEPCSFDFVCSIYKAVKLPKGLEFEETTERIAFHRNPNCEICVNSALDEAAARLQAVRGL